MIDAMSIVGVVLAVGALIGGNWLEGGHLDMLINGPAFIIVFGGTLGAVLLQTPLHNFMHAFGMARFVFLAPRPPLQETLKSLVIWSNIARREGLLGLEKLAAKQPDLFIRKGLQLVVDGGEPDSIRHTLELELETREQRDMIGAKVFESMAGYSPTIGIIGAVIGLIHVMQNLADPSRLGEGIATAFVATIYGVGFANLLLLPVANKLKQHALDISQFREMVIEGLVGISEGENPRLIEARLRGFLR